MSEVYSIVQEFLQDIPADADTDRYLDETIDGCEHVIYTGLALSLISNASNIEVAAGEDYLRERYGDPIFEGCDSLNDVATRMAYAILMAEAYKHVND